MRAPKIARFDVDFGCADHTPLSVPDMNCHCPNRHFQDQVLCDVNYCLGGLQFGGGKVDYIQAFLVSDQSAALICIEVKSHWNSTGMSVPSASSAFIRLVSGMR
jgi:hypothetical protein